MKALILVCALFVSPSVFAGFYLKKGDWRVLRTAHFEIIHDESQKTLAKLYADAGERAYQTLEPLFIEAPTSVIPVVIADVTDVPNGSATFMPYPLITIYPVLPMTTDTLSHYENWAYEIMLHEIAHIFSFVPAHGLYTPLKWIFGNIVRPTAILPRWYLEGLAVELESRYTTHGRLRAPGTAAALRALIADNALLGETLDRINESSIPTWPFGQRPYMYGALLWHRLVEDEGTGIIGDFGRRFGRRLPFFLDGPVEERTGTDWQGRWSLLKKNLVAELTLQLEQIRAKGEMDFAPVAEGQSQQNSPTISPDGLHLAYLNTSPFAGATVELISRPAGDFKSFSKLAPRSLMQVSSATRLAWLPDSTGLIVDHMHLVERYFRHRDLFLVRLNGAEPEQLTKGERASEPAVSPSGKSVAFVRILGGRNELAIMEIPTRKIRTLFKPKLGLRVSQPEFLDDQTLLFIGRDAKGRQRLYQMNLVTGKRQPFTSLTHVNWIQNTARGLLILSNKTEINNLYLHGHKTGAVEALTNARSEVTGGTLDLKANEILASHLTSQGRKLFVSNLKPYDPPTVSTPPSLKFGDKAPAPLVLKSAAVEDREYSAWRYMLPRYWIPFIYPVEGGLLFQGSTTVQDPIGRHTYGLQGTYDSVTNLAGYGVRYVHSRKPLDLGLTLAESNELLSSDSDPLTHRLQGVDGSFFIPGLENSWRGGVMFNHQTTEIPTGTGAVEIKRMGPGAQLSFNSSAAELSQPAWGDFGGSVSHIAYLPSEGYLDYERTTGALALNWRGPFPVRHALRAEIKAAYSPRLSIGNVVHLGDRTIGGRYLVSLINSNQILRGYPSGALVGRTLITSSLEYSFPLWDIFRGPGLFPWFSRELQMVFFADGATADGAYYNPEAPGYFRARTEDIFGGAGMEFILNNTVAYHLPVSVTLGLYYGFDERAGGGFTPFLSIGYSGHGGVDQSASSSTRLRPASFAR